MTPWQLSTRADPCALPLANRHYNRQSPDSDQFVPPGRCIVLLAREAAALWVTSWPFPQYVKHAWPGAWACSCFRNERADLYLSSDLIRGAVAITRARWQPPPLGMVTFIDLTKTRRKRDPGRCFLRAGFKHVGWTKDKGLRVLQLLPADMPPADYSLQGALLEVGDDVIGDPTRADLPLFAGAR